MSKLRGRFQQGAWYCDCEPRLPAVHFQTKKAGANHGRWFYTCQKQKDDRNRCKFFLWDSDAKPREQSALQNNSRTEPRPSRTIETPTRPQRAASPPPPYTTEAVSVRKRSRALVDEDEDEDEDDFGFDGADAAFGHELHRVVVAAETPSKAAKTESHSTPRRRLPWDTERSGAADGVPTPQTEQRTREPFQTRFAQPGGSFLTPSRFHDDEDHRQTMTPASSPFDTPTPSRFKDVKPDDIVQDVFGLLHEEGIALGVRTESNLKRLLERHARRAEGASKGREVARLQIKAKDAKITELTHMNNTLQAEVEAAKATMDLKTWERDNESDG